MLVIDYYKFETTANGNNTFTLVVPTDKDYDLYVYNAAGNQIGAAITNAATETMSLSNQPAGIYYVKVTGNNGANSTACYTIKASHAPDTQTSCQSIYDASGNDAFPGAVLTPFNTNITGSISPSGDNDYYKFEVINGGTATITLSYLPGDYDLSVINSSGTQLAASQNSGTTNETITRIYTPGTYYARVADYNNTTGTTSCYTLQITLGTASIAAESPITDDRNTTLTVYPNPATTQINVRIPATVAEHSLLSIIDINGSTVLQQNTTGNLQQIDISKLRAGVYLIKLSDGSGIMTAKFIKQ